MGRRAISPEQRAIIEEKLLRAIKNGVTYKYAALSAGIDEATFFAWRRRNSQFNQLVQKASAEAVVLHTTNVAKSASEGNWLASAWFLERRCPEDYARTEKRIISGDAENPLRIEGRTRPVFADEEVVSILEVLREAGAFSDDDDKDENVNDAELAEPVPTASSDDTADGIPVDRWDVP